MPTAYGATVLEHFRRPRNQRTLDTPTIAREGVNPLCGDRVRIELDLERDEIRAAAFTANACALCTAAASLLTERVAGARVQEALAISDAEAVGALGADVPAGRVACATLPLRTLREAITAHMDARANA